MNVFNNLIIFIILLISKSIRSWFSNYKFHVNVQTKCYCTNETVTAVLSVEYAPRGPYDRQSGNCNQTLHLTATTAWATRTDFIVDLTHDKCTTHPTSKIRVYNDCSFSRTGGYTFTCNER